MATVAAVINTQPFLIRHLLLLFLCLEKDQIAAYILFELSDTWLPLNRF